MKANTKQIKSDLNQRMCPVCRTRRIEHQADWCCVGCEEDAAHYAARMVVYIEAKRIMMSRRESMRLSEVA